MAKDPSPLLGYNNNIRHKNRVFHIQTEDSGVRHPHIITHLFMDGGRILKSVKTSYAEHLGVEKMADLVRKMMKDQHKGMLIALRDGQFDAVIDGGEAPKPSVSALAAVSAARASEPSAVELAPPSGPLPEPSAPALPVEAQPSSPAGAGIPEVERAAAHSHTPIFEPSPSDLEPPPANLFRQRTGGNYSTVQPESTPEAGPSPSISSTRPVTGRPQARPVTGRPPSARPASVPPGATLSRSSTAKPAVGSPASSRPSVSGGPPRPPPIRRASSPPPPLAASDPANRIARRPAAVVVAKPAESRYASARPAAIFGQSKPRGGSSIFGEDIISDKSLDEVIMSYLAEDIAAQDAPKTSSASSDPKRRK